MRRRIALLAATTLALVALAPGTVSAAAPTPSSSPGCGGLIVADYNHNSGSDGASGNSKSSAGPGYFLRQDTAGAIKDVRGIECPA